jgi:Cd2+/Zn2+-exporting ATPase
LTVGLILGVLSFIFSSQIVHYILLIASALCLGWKVYLKAFRLICRGTINENLLLTISVLGAILIKKDMEAVMVIALYSIGKILEGLAVKKSRNAIEKITNFKPEFAVVIINGEEIKVAPTEVKLGEKIIIRPGENVPIDCEILEGQTNLNTQSLTGESLPVLAVKGDKILSGSIVMDGMIIAKTTALYKDSTVSKILNLIENNQQKKSKVETTISKITKWYTLGVICASILTFSVVFFVTNELKTAFYRGLIFLVISCPCAFAISVPLSYFSGLGNASSKGILIKGSVYLDICSKIKTIVFDKTGTLTTGKFEIEKIVIEQKKLTEKDVLKLAAIGEQYSIHPLAKKITESVGKHIPSATDVKEIAGEGVYYSYNSNSYFVGRKTKNIEKTCVELFENNKLLARIYLHDNIKETSKKEINSLKKMGIKTVLLSGDKASEVKKIADEIQIDDFKSELLPQEKSKWIETEKEMCKDTLAFVGDGLNDAPSLTLADVGFCMGLEGNPASVEASDIVLSDDNPEKISKAIKISKFTRKIVWQNIGFSAFIKLLFLGLGAFGITGMLAAVIADVGVTVLAILNSLRALHFKP